jgi:hypothetical protein
VRLLQGLGYDRVREYRGGIEEWTGSSHPVDTQAQSQPAASNAQVPEITATVLTANGAAAPRSRTLAERRRSFANTFVDTIDSLSTGRLFLLWLAMILACGAVYWISDLLGAHPLVDGAAPLSRGIDGLFTAIYFSFTTATSVGYGDVLPLGGARVLAILEAVGGLLVFGAIVSKFVSRRQDRIVSEIHRITFEDRLDRVQTGLHTVLGDFQLLGDMCTGGMIKPERLGARLESSVLLFSGELRAIHDLLYQPRNLPPEPILAAILASLFSSLQSLCVALECLPQDFHRPYALERSLVTVSGLADGICADCVPQVYTANLRNWMDRIHDLAARVK